MSEEAEISIGRMSRPIYYGTDDVTYAVNSTGYVYLTIPKSPLQEGFVRVTARTAAEKEAVWAKLDAQEKVAATQMTEALFAQRVQRMANVRDYLSRRAQAVDCTPAERDFIKAAAAVLERKEQTLMRNSVYGVAAMQEREAPIAPTRQKVVLTDG